MVRTVQTAKKMPARREAVMAERPSPIWLLARFDSGSGVLALDLRAPQHVVTAEEMERLEKMQPAALVIADLDDVFTLLSRPDEGLTVSRACLWSLLDPVGFPHQARETGAEPGEPTSWVDAEAELRREAQRIWARLDWWAQLPAELRARCETLLATAHPGHDRLITLLDQLARTRDMNPFAGWPGAAAEPGTPIAAAAESADRSNDRKTGRQDDAPRATTPLDLPAWTDPPEDIDRWVRDPAGLGAVYGSHFTPRPEQAEMAGAVASSLQSDRPLLVEAGTGVGKTLAYLVPLLVALRAGGEARAVIATYTRALQNQLLDHDLPRLRRLVPHLRCALLKGRSNYLCARQREAFLARPLAGPADALRRVAFLLWLEATVDGGRDELAAHPLLRGDLRELFDTPLPCVAGRCNEGAVCYVQRARRRARAADLVVVNHALLLHDLGATRSLLGPYRWLVVDEAHRLPEVALATHAIQCNRRRFAELSEWTGRARGAEGIPERIGLVRQCLVGEGEAGRQTATAVADFGRAISRYRRQGDRWWQAVEVRFAAARQQLPETARGSGRVRVGDKDEAFGPLREATAELLATVAEASAALAELTRRADALEAIPVAVEDDLAVLAQIAPWLDRLEADIRFLTGDADEDWVSWFDAGPGTELRSLGATHLEAGPLLRESWSGANLRPVMTSATLAIGEDFGFALAELGLSGRRPPTVTKLVASPFDFEHQARFLIPSPFPAPDATEFATATAELLQELVQANPRQILALFTSYRLLESVGSELRAATGDLFATAPEQGAAVKLLMQSPRSSAAELLQRFRAAGRSLLLGTTTFWEGVDFPGRELEILVITKLPFLVPSDPWVAARCERIAARGEDAFTTFMIRDAVLRLRQGVGRLVRRHDDRGVIVLLDNRLHTRAYGATFLGALPVVPRICSDTQALAAAVADFFSTQGRGS